MIHKLSWKQESAKINQLETCRSDSACLLGFWAGVHLSTGLHAALTLNFVCHAVLQANGMSLAIMIVIVSSECATTHHGSR